MDTLLEWLALTTSAMHALAAWMQPAASALDLAALIALAAALGWASGLRLYAVLFITGLTGALNWIHLPQGLSLLQHPVMLVASGGMLFVEFFIDKIPGLDSIWDMLHSVIRVPAGAALAAAVFGADSATMAVAAAVMGGTLSAASFSAKASTRAAVNTSPEPVSNVAVSLFEDGLVLAGFWLAVKHPLLFICALVVVTALMLFLVYALLRFLRAVLSRVASMFGQLRGFAFGR